MSQLLALAVIGLGLISAWQFLRGLRRRPPLFRAREEALRLLEQRYARGEVGPREFEERRQALRGR